MGPVRGEDGLVDHEADEGTGGVRVQQGKGVGHKHHVPHELSGTPHAPSREGTLAAGGTASEYK